MLAFFQIKRIFNKLQVTMTVDCEHREAEILVKYDHRIVRAAEHIPFHEVMTPELADRWFANVRNERGTFMESLEWQIRSGILQTA